MKDSQENERTHTSWLEFGYWLVQTAKKHDTCIEKCSEELNELQKSVSRIDFRIDENEKLDKKGWTTAEKILAIVAWLITTGISLYALLK